MTNGRIVRVVLVEDDPFARDMMCMILMRDWRTEVVEGVEDRGDLVRVLRGEGRVDVVIIDVERPGDEEWRQLALTARNSVQRPRVICTCTHPSLEIAKEIADLKLDGYVMKQEVCYALAWTVVRAADGYFVTTPAIEPLLEQIEFNQARPFCIHDEANLQRFSAELQPIVRLSILFNMSSSDIAHELNDKTDLVRDKVRRAYGRLELHDLIEGVTNPEDIFPRQDRVIKRFENAQAQRRQKRQAFRQKQESAIATGKRPQSTKPNFRVSDQTTLAFHLLTVPDEILVE